MMRCDNSKNKDHLIVDFVGGAVAHRYKFGGGRRQALPKAIGMKGGINPNVVDATAGLGRDSFLMASLGACVTMIERSPDIYKLLADGMARATMAGGTIADIMSRMTLIQGDAKDLLPTLKTDVILVDPMYPPRQNSALVKQEMRLIRDIVGIDDDRTELMKIALVNARKRVVLKWPQKAAPMDGIQPPSHQITGKSTCYNVWMIPAQG